MIFKHPKDVSLQMEMIFKHSKDVNVKTKWF